MNITGGKCRRSLGFKKKYQPKLFEIRDARFY